ncbi:MAG: Holliday junction resolvase [Gammaproteobacteria bacterium]|jgi:putative Holliday junction resolvase|nr:Holliday junction resolvase [Gammaproteobacteria bacterium]
MPNINTVLGFDFGLRRIGIAAGQSITKTATPIPGISAKAGVPNWQEVAKLIKEWQPQALLVGIPLLMDDKEQPMTESARQFAMSLKQFNLPVYEVDERLSTREARSRLSEINEFKNMNHRKVDSMAACIIVETFLNNIEKT